MDKHVSKTARTLLKNVATRLKRVALGRESLRDAFDGITDDADRLKRAAKGAKAPGSHHKASQYVEKGRRAYNDKNYEMAEDFFRRAIIEDPQYALAFTYLGSTLYNLQRISDATHMWMKAIELEPGSDAARKAEQRLRKVKSRKDAVIADIERSIRGD
ncbi:MAG TPA: hypothetical protein PLJ47_12210 [Candidatus Hydrogenedentes bacterium]|nr:hypothetical protein [Candidatus Hydrogenedentota bacterium]HRK35350.1 hypothetical protein [Candidatus Hydrogenedentota bacterium]